MSPFLTLSSHRTKFGEVLIYLVKCRVQKEKKTFSPRKIVNYDFTNILKSSY